MTLQLGANATLIQGLGDNVANHFALLLLRAARILRRGRKRERDEGGDIGGEDGDGGIADGSVKGHREANMKG